LRPATNPHIEQQTVARGTALEFVAAIEVFPEIKKLDIAGMTIERPVAVISQEDVQRTLDTIRRQRVSWNTVARAAQTGDRVKIDFAGTIDGEAIQGGAAKDFYTVIGAGTLIEDLDKGLVGMKAGDAKTITASFPADYRAAILAGKTAAFDVKLHDVAESVMPEMTSEFVQQLGVTDGDIEKLHAEIKMNLEREAAQRARRIVRVRALKALLTDNNFDIPVAMLDAEVAELRRLEQRTGAHAEEAVVREQARKRVAVGLTLAEVIRARNLKAEPARVRAKLEEMASEYESPEMFIRWHYEQPQRMAQVESLVVEERAVEELLTQAKIEERSMPFQDLLKAEAEATY
jgi:trigger factor